jgi:hypothetical protein
MDRDQIGGLGRIDAMFVEQCRVVGQEFSQGLLHRSRPPDFGSSDALNAPARDFSTSDDRNQAPMPTASVFLDVALVLIDASFVGLWVLVGLALLGGGVDLLADAWRRWGGRP